MIRKLLDLARKCWDVWNQHEPKIRGFVFWVSTVEALISRVFNYYIKRLIYA